VLPLRVGWPTPVDACGRDAVLLTTGR
jgi:hypothetical protein